MDYFFFWPIRRKFTAIQILMIKNLKKKLKNIAFVLWSYDMILAHDTC